MKMFIDEVVRANEIRARLDASKANEDQLLSKWASEAVSKKSGDSLFYPLWKGAELETHNLKVELCFVQNNARVALFHDVLPSLIDVLEKYDGQPYDGDTIVKFSEEIERKTGCRAFINLGFGEYVIRILPNIGMDTYCISIGTKFGRKILVDNKIESLPLECFELLDIRDEYIEDIPIAVQRMNELYCKAVKLQSELQSVCVEYSKYVVKGIKPLNATSYIHGTLIDLEE